MVGEECRLRAGSVAGEGWTGEGEGCRVTWKIRVSLAKKVRL